MKQLLQESRSKKNISKVAHLAVNDPDGFKELILLMADKKEEYLASLAAWAASDATKLNRDLIKPYFRDLINIISETSHDSIKRNIVRIWQFVNIPEKYEWEIADICFRFLASPKEAVAIKAFSLTVLQNLVKRLPELKGEVMFEIEKQLPHSGAAFTVRARNFLKAHS